MCTVPVVRRSGNRIAVAALKKPWSKRLLERAEKKAVKEFERELRETAEKEKEVSSNIVVPATISVCFASIGTKEKG